MNNRSRFGPWLFPLTHWNWKAVLITAICRAAACMVATWHSPLHAREHFGAVEAVYVLVTAGIFSAWQQQALDAKPRRLAWAIVMLAIPLGSLAADSALHLWLDNGNMRALGIWSVHRYHYLGHVPLARNAERSLLVGNDSRSFGEDIKQMPRLVASFVWKPVRLVIRGCAVKSFPPRPSLKLQR